MNLPIFAILKNGRRYEDVNYLEKSAAEKKLSKILAAREHFNSLSRLRSEKMRFTIVELSKPNKAW